MSFSFRCLYSDLLFVYMMEDFLVTHARTIRTHAYAHEMCQNYIFRMKGQNKTTIKNGENGDFCRFRHSLLLF